MSDLNQFAVTGRLTKDPELRMLPSGTALASFSIAVNRDYKKDEEWVEEVSFFDVKMFGGRAETVVKKAAKGDRVTAAGRLQQERWETDEGNRSKVVLIASQIEGECFFKPASENNEVAAVAADDATPAAVAADDDIPF